MTHSKNATALVKQFEGCRLYAYQDQNGVWTIGWGSTGPAIHGALKWSQAQADAALELHICQIDAQLNSLGMPQMTQNQWDAIVSLTYNIGIGNFEKSTVLREIKAGNIKAAAQAFLMWDKTGPDINPGLVRRRTAEQQLFNTP